MNEEELEKLRDRFRGCLLGSALGDALGLPFEGTPVGGLDGLRRALEDRVSRSRPWAFSDDSQMLLDLGEALLASGGLNRRRALGSLRAGYDPVRGYGKGMKLLFAALDRGEDLESLPFVAWSEGSRGNGGVVRLPPLVCFYHRHEALTALARDSCSWTHAHPHALSASTIFAAILDELLALPEPEDFEAPASLSALRAGLADGDPFHGRLSAILDLLARTPGPKEVVARLGHDVLAEASLPAAIYAVCVGGGFKEVVTRAVGLGGDTDTIGAMAGALAGARYGFAAIPSLWVENLERGGRERLSGMAGALLDSWVARITGLA